MDAEKVAWPIALVTAVFGGGGLWAWLQTRTTASTSPPAAMVTAAADFAEAAAKVSETFGEAGATLVRALGTELAGVRGELAELRIKIDACEERHDGCELALATMRREFDAYVRDNPPAAYAPSDLRRPVR